MGTTVKWILILTMAILVKKTQGQNVTKTGIEKINSFSYTTDRVESYSPEDSVWAVGKGYSLHNKRLFDYIQSSTKDKKIYSKGKMEVVGSLIIITERFYQYNPGWDFEIRFFCQEKNGEIKLQESKRFLKGKIVSEYKPPKEFK